MSPSEFPDNPDFPHGEVIGGFLDIPVRNSKGGEELVRMNWDAQLLHHEGQWWAVFIDDKNQLTSLSANGPTPRAAFESLVKRWTLANGGVESPFLRGIIGSIRAELDAFGLTE